MALPYDIANSAPHPWDTGKFTTLGPHSVARGLHIAALGPRAFGSTALWRQFDNFRPEGDIIFGPWVATFSVSQGWGAELAISYGRANTFIHPNAK